MFGVSFPELMLIGAVALIIVGPQRLPGMLGTLGKWSNKLRRMLFDVRQQSGIDDILRAEGITGGLKEIRDLRNAVRGNVAGLLTAGAAAPRQGVQQAVNQAKAGTPAAAPPPVVSPPPEVVTDPYADVPYDRSREYPDEGCDGYGTIPDDLWAAAHPEPKPQAAASQAPAVQTSDAGALSQAAVSQAAVSQAAVSQAAVSQAAVSQAAVSQAAVPLAAAAVVDAVLAADTAAPPDPQTDAQTLPSNDSSAENPVAPTDDTAVDKAPAAPPTDAPDAPEADEADDSSPDTDPTVS